MLLAGVMRTSERRHGSSGEMYANQRHMVALKKGGTVWGEELLKLSFA
jgi:hypothetical protein